MGQGYPEMTYNYSLNLFGYKKRHQKWF